MIRNTRPDNFNPKFEIVSCLIEFEGKILLLKRQTYKPQPNKYSLPAGKVECNENIKEAIIREVKEETSIDLTYENVEFYKTKYVDYDDYQFIYHSFHCTLNNNPNVKINKNEHQLYIWETPEKSLKIDLIQDEDSCIMDFYKLKAQ